MDSNAAQRIAETVDSVARLHGYPFPDRRDLWLARFADNLPELEYLESLTDAGPCRYAPPAVAPQLQGIPPPARTPGVAAIAEQARASDHDVGEAAETARTLVGQHGDLHAFVQLADAGELADQAAAARDRARRGAAMPLLGVPVAVKDLMAVKGFRQTNGSGMAPGASRDVDAPAVGRLRDAGAIILGTANLHELAYGITSVNPHFGAVVNPRGPDATPGGSSGGSAAAVAAGIVRVAIGTDTAGSIRIPAACCGVVGFKPGYDVVPRDGALALGATLDHLGPLARSVDDAALLFSVMAGQPAQVPRRLPDLRGLRVGLPRAHFFDPLAADVRRVVEAAARTLEADGAVLVDVDVADVADSPSVQFATLCSEATATHWRRLVDHPETLGEDVRVRLEIGQFMPAIWYVRAQGARARLASALDAVLHDVDVLLTPTLRTTAPKAGAATVTIDGHHMPLHAAVTSLTLPFNLTGLPAITLPCGDGDDGLPVGLQLAGRAGDDWRVLAVAKRVESILGTGAPNA